MGLTGSKPELIKIISYRQLEAKLIKAKLSLSRFQQSFNRVIAEITSFLQEAKRIEDADLSLRVERLCINFEISEYATTKDDKKRLDKQLSENAAAQNSLDLVQNIPAYRKLLSEVFPNGIEKLPEGEAYIVHARRQINQLGHYQKGFATSQEKAFFAARQENLRAGIAAFKKLQKQALFPDKI